MKTTYILHPVEMTVTFFRILILTLDIDNLRKRVLPSDVGNYTSVIS